MFMNDNSDMSALRFMAEEYSFPGLLVKAARDDAPGYIDRTITGDNEQESHDSAFRLNYQGPRERGDQKAYELADAVKAFFKVWNIELESRVYLGGEIEFMFAEAQHNAAKHDGEFKWEKLRKEMKPLLAALEERAMSEFKKQPHEREEGIRIA